MGACKHKDTKSKSNSSLFTKEKKDSARTTAYDLEVYDNYSDRSYLGRSFEELEARRVREMVLGSFTTSTDS